jgi:hypothetical protein
VTCREMPDPLGRSDLKELAGLPEADVVARLVKDKISVRVAERDGQHYLLTSDFKPKRVNLKVVQGRVAGAYYG